MITMLRSQLSALSKPCREILRHGLRQVLCQTHKLYSSTAQLTHPADLIGLKLPEKVVRYTERDAILYALAVGMTVEHRDSLRFLYENDPAFSALPSYGSTVFNPVIMDMCQGNFPLPLDVDKLLHAEHYVELKQPLPPGAVLVNKPVIIDVLDKGKGTLIAFGIDSYDEEGRHVLYNECVAYTSQYKGWSERRRSDKLIPSLPTPSRLPDATTEQQTSTSQAALYRLVGDHNAFHIDPDMAKNAGLERPVLHGLCSFGFSSRHVMEKYCDNDPSKFKSAKVRFTRPVLPGQTLQTNMWQETTGIHFQTKVLETGVVCLSGAHVELHK